MMLLALILMMPIAHAVPTLRVRVTGYGPFLNFSTNPSMQTAQFLDGQCFDEATFRQCFTATVLPVNRTGVTAIEHELVNNQPFGYDALLHMGLEDGLKGLKLEVAAVNIRANDTGGPSTMVAVPGAPALLPTTADLGHLQTSLVVPSVPELWSRDAGTYVRCCCCHGSVQ